MVVLLALIVELLWKMEMVNSKMAMVLGSTGILACAAGCQVRGVARCEETMAAFFCGVGVLAAILNLGLSGAGFCLSSRDHLVRIRTKAKIGLIAEWRRRTGRSACATQGEKNDAVPHAKN
jgi:hypothetical protein